MTQARILVVEDHPMNRRLVRDLLQHHGHQVTEAATADEGWAELHRSLPDLVLLDVQIPGGGEHLLGKIRSDPKLMRLPVIAVTALAMQGDRERLLQGGFDGYLSKPIHTRSFPGEIESFLQRKGANHDHPGVADPDSPRRR